MAREWMEKTEGHHTSSSPQGNGSHPRVTTPVYRAGFSRDTLVRAERAARASGAGRRDPSLRALVPKRSSNESSPRCGKRATRASQLKPRSSKSKTGHSAAEDNDGDADNEYQRAIRLIREYWLEAVHLPVGAG